MQISFESSDEFLGKPMTPATRATATIVIIIIALVFSFHFVAKYFIFIAGLVTFYFGFNYLSQKRLIENTPTSKARSVAIGPAELVGKADFAEKPLVAPITGEDCVYWRYEVKELHQHGKSSSWDTIDQGVSQSKFYIVDETGRVLVNPEGAKVDIPFDFLYEWKSYMFTKPKPPSAKLFTEFVQKHKINLSGPPKKFIEWHIEPKDPLYIFGAATEIPGVVSAVASENIVIAKSKLFKLFYISDRSQQDVIKDFGMRATLYIVGGVLMSAVSLFTILTGFP